MRSNNRGIILAAGAGLILASCTSENERARAPSRPRPAPARAVADLPVKIGPPYSVRGRTYTPEDAVNYDEVGYASWYGDELAGTTTANGEAFVPSGVTAAHPTLPLPSYVEVTALETGRTILVRVNDRGPFTEDRIIDLSRGAAEQLGLNGAAAVRVRRVSPSEQERALLRAHGRAAERLETPASLLSVLRERLGARPVATPASPAGTSQPRADRADGGHRPPARVPDGFIVEHPGARPSVPAPPPRDRGARPGAAGGYVVQVAAFSSRERATRLARAIGAGTVEGGGVWRVRFGPYPDQNAAQAGVRAARARGYHDAQIIRTD